MFNIFKKRRSKPLLVNIENENHIYKKILVNSDDVTRNFSFLLSEGYYYLLYRDNRYLGTVTNDRKEIYPFSDRIHEKGGIRNKKQFSNAELVCIRKNICFPMYWKSSFSVTDDVTEKSYSIDASGLLYFHICPYDLGESCYWFYVRTINFEEPEKVSVDSIAELLGNISCNMMGCAIDTYMRLSEKKQDDFMQLSESEILKMSKGVCGHFINIYDSYCRETPLGLAVDEEKSESTAITNFVIKENK